MEDQDPKNVKKKRPKYVPVKDITLAHAILLAIPPQSPEDQEPEGWHEAPDEDDH